MRFLLSFCCCLLVLSAVKAGDSAGRVKIVRGLEWATSLKPPKVVVKDTLKQRMIDRDTTDGRLLNTDAEIRNSVFKAIGATVTLESSELALFPAVTLQQYLKGHVPGLYIQEPTGEPGTNQNMFIRGNSGPLLSPADVFESQPLVVLDGVPLIADHPYALDIQQYSFNNIGPATNFLSNIDMDNIESVEVLKDLAATAIYGPRAANGVIVLKSKTARNKKQISFNSYIGLVQRRKITTINGKYENAFRKQFFDRYKVNGLNGQDEYPLYLADSLNSSYYGPSNWSDLHYQNRMVHSINAGLSGGSEKANFRFSVGNLRQQGVADATAINRYSAMFRINMKPMDWFTFSTLVNANRTERDRNKSLRDRFAHVNYIPDLSSPLIPNRLGYEAYLQEFDQGFDDNILNSVEGFADIGIKFGNFDFHSRFGIDYNAGFRDVFYPQSLLQSTNFTSNFVGVNQRIVLENVGTYNLGLESDNDLYFELGSSLQFDTHKYNKTYGYKGANDLIKLNLIESNPGAENYMEPSVFDRALVFRFLDKTKNNLASFFGRATYNHKEKYTLSVLLRSDGSSNAQPTNRWFVSSVISGGWNVKEVLLDSNDFFSMLKLRSSIGRLGRVQGFDHYAQGPHYSASIGYTGNLIVPGYNGFGTLSRPYSAGWVGYNIPWAHSDQVNFGFDIGVLNNRLRASVDLYSITDKDQLIGIPSNAEYGYTVAYENGLSVNNSGIDVLLSAEILPSINNFSWTSSLNFNINRNELRTLPNGLTELAIDNRLLKVGESTNQYWLLTNEGIYNAESEIPVNPETGIKLSYKGIEFEPGDPKWKDLNRDFVIDDLDKSLMGNSMPLIAGGFNNVFRYGNWNLSLNFYYNLGKELINQEMANRFDFVNQEDVNNINSVKEITFWEKRGDYDKYPLYNPWSLAIPYRVNQDLFLEEASFLKLRSVSLGYDLSSLLKGKMINKVFIYGTVNNLFTITPYTGQDPELVNYTGYDTGYGMSIPITYTFGVKMDL